MQQLVNREGFAITKFPHRLTNGMNVLRFERPSQKWPSGKIVLNDGHQNYVAAPHIYNMTVLFDGNAKA